MQLRALSDMATFPNRNMKQKCVYWGNPTDNGYGGYTYDDPVELPCRWVGSTKVITDSKGQQVVCRAEVQVEQDVDENGLLYLGNLNDLDSAEEETPTSVERAYLIKRFDKVPTIRGDKFYRKAYL